MNSDSGPKANKLNASTYITIVFVVVSAFIFRLGGRAAFLSFLGLDFVADIDIKSKLDALLLYFENIGEINEIILFFLSWIVVKTLCLDTLTIILALSSGILFHGFWQGTVLSVAAATFASSLNFLFVRQFYKEKLQTYIQSRSVLRNIDKACAREGFKTVLTLRLSPILPIPIASYSYLYGATSISLWNFITGLSLGSVKPYAFDCYLGLVTKSIIDQDATQNEPLVFIAFSAIVLVGILSTQLATKFYEELMQSEENTDSSLKEEETVQDDINRFISRVFGIKSDSSNENQSFLYGLKFQFNEAW